MPTTSISSYLSDGLSEDLYLNLIAGKDFSIPALDLSDAQFDVPIETGNDLYTAISQISEGDLTSRTVGGDGVFDGLMVSLGAHLKEEYDNGRITGKEYANAYVAVTTNALGSALQFLLGRDQAYWQAQLAQKQARAAEIEAVRARLVLETSRAELASARANAETVAVNYAVTKMQLAISDESYGLTQAQKAQIVYQTGNILPAQLGQITAETQIRDYEHDHILPKERDRIQSQIDTSTAQISHITAQKDQVIYETTSLLPSQKLKLDSEKDVVVYQLSNILPAQLVGMNYDNTAKNYTNTSILPAQLISIQEQTEAHRAKTLDTRTDGTTPIAGAIGKQKDLHSQQIDSYKRDAEWKVGKGLLDTWITQKSLDEGLTPPSSLTDSNINTVMNRIRVNTGLDN